MVAVESLDSTTYKYNMRLFGNHNEHQSLGIIAEACGKIQ
jgi:hypothetical protein